MSRVDFLDPSHALSLFFRSNPSAASDWLTLVDTFFLSNDSNEQLFFDVDESVWNSLTFSIFSFFASS